MSDNSRITGAASVMGAATLVSRVLGYTRDAVIAYVFGAGMSADAFFVAFRLSNLFRRLVGEGALTTSFVPVFTEVMAERPVEEVRAFVSRFFSLFFLILLALAFVGIIFSPVLVKLMSPGFSVVSEKFALTVSLTRLMFPYVVFIGLMAVAMGVLNSYRHFAAPSISPIFFNISIIVLALALTPFLERPVYALAIGVIVGGVLQFVLQLPFLKRYGMTPVPALGWVDPAIKKIFLLMAPAVVGIGIYQLNIFVTMRFASRLPEGSVSYLYYASRLMELPLGVFGVSITQAVLPSLSEYAAKKDLSSFRDSLSFALRIANFVNIPATAGLIALSIPIIDILFVRGEFSGGEARATAFALYFYAAGIVPVAASRILVSVFYSLKDTITPVWGALFSFFFNILMCLLLIGPLRHGGLALATSLSAVLNLLFLGVILHRRVRGFGLRGIFSSAVRSAIAAVVMGVSIHAVVYYTGWDGLGILSKAMLLVASITIGMVLYVVLSFVLGVAEVSFLKELIAERLQRKRGEKSA